MINRQVAMWDISTAFDSLKPIKSNDWNWNMSTDYPKTNGLKVASMFSCGGGSTMGYKLSGCEVIANVEIDPKMNEVYKLNHHPKYSYLMDIRDFNKLTDLPKELYNLDILDGSPPCTTFSLAGQREKNWGKKKKFREGQALQTLDDLSFVFIDTIAKLKPKTAIIENVSGLLAGNAFKYVQEMYSQLNAIGYVVKFFLLKGESMGVPQKRHRVFFICVRNDIQFDLNKLDMSFNYAPILFKEIRSRVGKELNPTTQTYNLLQQALPTDKCLSHIIERLGGKARRFNELIVWDNNVAPTIHNHGTYRGIDKTQLSDQDFINCGTFPQDYKYSKNIAYIVGMSVPPVMIKRVVTRLIESGLYNYKLNRGEL